MSLSAIVFVFFVEIWLFEALRHFLCTLHHANLRIIFHIVVLKNEDFHYKTKNSLEEISLEEASVVRIVILFSLFL